MIKTVSIILVIVLAVAAIDIKLSQASEKASSREIFWTDVLKFVLDHSNVPHTITVTYEMTQSRVIKELKENTGRINLHVMGTSAQLEEDLLPIRIPFARGLAGHRVFIIQKDYQPLFDTITTLKQLQQL